MNAPHIHLLSTARALISSYSNSLSHVLGGRDRQPLQSARAALDRQLQDLETLFNRGEYERDPEHAIGAVVLTSHYFEYTLGLIERKWPGLLAEVRKGELYRALLSVRMLHAHGHDRLLFFSERARVLHSQSDRTAFFVARIAAGLDLYNEFASSLKAGVGVSDRERLSRTLVFDPAHKQAAISILSYFGEVVARKYPDMDVGVRIEQQGTKITLVVETPRGELERIEQELSNYGLVVTGQVTPEQYLSRPGDAMMLRHKLEMAQLEIRQTKELLASERANFGARIESLESNVQFMRTMLDKAQYESAMVTAALRDIAASNTASIARQLDELSSLVAKHAEDTEGALLHTLREIHRESPSVIDRINELFVKGSIQGAAGNYLYAGLTALQKVLM